MKNHCILKLLINSVLSPLTRYYIIIKCHQVSIFHQVHDLVRVTNSPGITSPTPVTHFSIFLFQGPPPGQLCGLYRVNNGELSALTWFFGIAFEFFLFIRPGPISKLKHSYTKISYFI